MLDKYEFREIETERERERERKNDQYKPITEAECWCHRQRRNIFIQLYNIRVCVPLCK